MASHSIELPHGCRSCALDVTGRPLPRKLEWISSADFDQQELATDAFPPSLLATTWARFDNKMKRAQDGQLKFGPGKRNDVDRMSAAKDVLELKWSNLPPGAEDKGIWLRLYFSEPQRLPHKLIQLHLECKEKDNPEGQTKAAKLAQMRLEKHFAGTASES